MTMRRRISYARMRLGYRITTWFEPRIWRVKLDVEDRQHQAYLRFAYRWGERTASNARAASRSYGFWTWISRNLGNEIAPVLGRYEGESSPTKTAWLDDHSEYASSTTGDTQWLGHYALFVSLPWNVDGAAILCTTEQGFRSMTEYRGADAEHRAQDDFGVIERDFYADNEGAGFENGPRYDDSDDDPDPTYGPSFLDRDEIRAANTLED